MVRDSKIPSTLPPGIEPGIDPGIPAMREMPDLAICVRHGVKHYGRGSGKVTILNNINMSVQKGCIYGLLGASGCGKTTLLSCLVGVRHLDAGVVSVLGLAPGAPGSCVPGPRVGFMPQEIALVQEFTVREMVHYYGMVFGMDEADVEARLQFLAQLLELPPDTRYISSLSGGQQRRVSFAVALLSNPELLILDEPTVGLDPLLRQAIWDFLVEISSSKKVTVIVTTHYIEEARGAHTVGLLRGGKLLAENSPQELLSMYRCPNLEDVFLRLCTKQGESGIEPDINIDTSAILPIENKSMEEPLKSVNVSPPDESSSLVGKSSTQNRLKALLIKNYKQILRNKGGLIFLICFPILQIALYFGAVGGHPESMHLAIVNEEYPNATNCSEYFKVFYDTTLNQCTIEGVSCRFLDKINGTLAIKDYYEDKETAFRAVALGDAIGVIHFAQNFSMMLQERELDGRYSSDDVINGSNINVHLDMTDYQVGHIFKRRLRDIYDEMIDEVSIACHRNVKNGHIPIYFNDPIFGEREPSYVFGLIPGNSLMIIYFLSAVLTSTTFISERLAGVWDRNLVAGITNGEIFFSHLISQLTNVLVECAGIFAVILAFSVPCVGNMGWVFFLVYLQGVAGMCFGLTVSVITQNITFANYMAVGAFMPAFLLGGIIWPVEGMPTLIKMLSLSLPSTLPSYSIRYVMEKGWDITDFQVLLGYLITVGWIVGHCVFSLVVLRTQKH